ncbi:MAG: ABC transporter ATP-binding protein [Clostridia bacterium]|nr:ABC transporter ATP-binding protein [Clostridia bacterium]MBQ7913692.1 ABC transporter ATP-binding protein [Clostridia bacterium]
MPLLQVNQLHTCFKTRRGTIRAVNDVTFSLERAKTLALVGESGSGKSVSAMSVLRLLDENGYIEKGEILFEDGEKITDLTKLNEKQMNAVRGDRISVIFQEPMTALNPVFTIGRQVGEPYQIHRGMSKKEAWQAGVKMLEKVRIPNPERVAKQYAHQLSGGMRQRVVIAMALACKPDVLIADEPTTALDVTIQAQILQLMRELQRENQTAILFITHDLGVVNEMADDVAVMYCGQIVERVPAPVLFSNSAYSHPYTEGLMNSAPSAQNPQKRLETIAGNVPHPLDLPKGCKFSPRCKYCTKRCQEEEPSLAQVPDGENHFIRCFYPKKEERKSAEHANLALHKIP